ncbi:cobyric acid synthase [Ureibacillus sp. FSL W8-0352]|uniref:cobyric acid synthase n=1 Tax=Ureibacillus sp. FSL W8-0352 TaxID=2954596 RepID=UPI0030F6D97A
MRANSIMIQGTSSDVGKSVLCTALCRIFSNAGYKVAPFKSQNMALNSYVTKDGGEIGRAQGVQAEAAREIATTKMNPILLKPKQDMVSEVIVHGKHFKDMSATNYRDNFVLQALPIVEKAIRELEQSYDIIVAEGAGSPAEINLKDRDIANMRVAKMLNADVFLVADIDRGGVFASIVGTLALLDEDERKLVKGIIINKFRGMIEILENGIKWLEEYTGIPVIGVIPYFDLKIEAEDSLALDTLKLKRPKKNDSLIDVVCIQLPRISNFTDLDPLFDEPDVGVRFVSHASDLGNPDCIIIPGTKNTTADLEWLKETGLFEAIQQCSMNGSRVFGICGGYQILGEKLFDPDFVESDIKETTGLCLLPIQTTFEKNKRTTQTKGKIHPMLFNKEIDVKGYEIHLGQTKVTQDSNVQPFLQLDDGSCDGIIFHHGKVIGTYLHGIFQNRSFTRAYFNEIRKSKGLKELSMDVISDKEQREQAYDVLAQHVQQYLNMEYIYSLLENQKKVKGGV